MSLPTKAIDRLFERLAATYGASWSRQWADVPVMDAKTAWAHELSGQPLDSIAWALENLPERCPNVIEFRNLCQRQPAKATVFLPEARQDPERLKQEFAKLSEIKKTVTSDRVDHKAWAKRILARYTAGERINPTSLRFAREAVRENT